MKACFWDPGLSNSGLHVTVDTTYIRETTPGTGPGGSRRTCKVLESLSEFESWRVHAEIAPLHPTLLVSYMQILSVT